jgi:Zn finger protein HypA/HybF involved in hydrogenase expression
MDNEASEPDLEAFEHFKPGSMGKGYGVEIIHNRAKCTKCGDIIESKHVHDFVWCKCKTIAVDGGREYLKRAGNFAYLEDISEVVDHDDEG